MVHEPQDQGKLSQHSFVDSGILNLHFFGELTEASWQEDLYLLPGKYIQILDILSMPSLAVTQAPYLWPWGHVMPPCEEGTWAPLPPKTVLAQFSLALAFRNQV